MEQDGISDLQRLRCAIEEIDMEMRPKAGLPILD
jgi:hypothetical protein